MSNTTYDVIIIGGGPAGLTAGIYTSRERINTLLLEKGLCGGLPASTEVIENYPGFPEGINGAELVNKLKKQAQKFGTEIIEFKEVKRVEPGERKINVATDEEEYGAYAVIVASGSIPKPLNIPGEEKFRGKGVSYCATCDGPLYRDKDVAVVGGGDRVELDGSEYIKTNEEMETSAPGIYALGDIRSKKVRQIDVACGEATIASVSARDYLKGLK